MINRRDLLVNGTALAAALAMPGPALGALPRPVPGVVVFPTEEWLVDAWYRAEWPRMVMHLPDHGPTLGVVVNKRPLDLDFDQIVVDVPGRNGAFVLQMPRPLKTSLNRNVYGVNLLTGTMNWIEVRW